MSRPPAAYDGDSAANSADTRPATALASVNAGLIPDTDRSSRRLPRCDEAKWVLVPRERASSGAALPVRPRPSGAPALPARERVRALRVPWLDSARGP
jgi:hypothetical protein